MTDIYSVGSRKKKIPHFNKEQVEVNQPWATSL